MNITRKGIINLILSLVLVIGLTFVMSSCSFEFSFDGFFDDFIDDDGNNILTPGDQFDDEIKDPVFYPDSGSSSLDDVSAEKKTLFSTVSIIADWDGTPGAGSGVIYQLDKEKGDAYIITNYHVIYYDGIASKINLYLYGMQSKSYAIPATFVGGSLTNDIAVLKVTGSEVLKKSNAIAATFGDSELVRVFDEAIVVGNPEGYGMSVTKGIISVESESLDLVGADGSLITLRVIRTDAAVNQGNSGGGLYNSKGELVGLVSAKMLGETIDNLGFAIPSNLVKNLVDNIIDNCNGDDKTQIQRPLLGVTIVASSLGVVIGPDGDVVQAQIVTVDSVNEGSAASSVLKAGDIINSVTVDGVKYEITKTYQLPDIMLSARVGSTVVMNITRGEQTLDTATITVTAEMINPID